MLPILRLLSRSQAAKVCPAMLEKINTILGAAKSTSRELQEQFGGDGASVALAAALGRLCAEAGINLSDALAIAEVAHREASSELKQVAA